MSTAKDIFTAIIDGDNINLTEHIATALYNRSLEKVELMKENVGKSLFNEEETQIDALERRRKEHEFRQHQKKVNADNALSAIKKRQEENKGRIRDSVYMNADSIQSTPKGIHIKPKKQLDYDKATDDEIEDHVKEKNYDYKMKSLSAKLKDVERTVKNNQKLDQFKDMPFRPNPDRSQAMRSLYPHRFAAMNIATRNMTPEQRYDYNNKIYRNTSEFSTDKYTMNDEVRNKPLPLGRPFDGMKEGRKIGKN